jgi:branched-chain amino acid aminotransferase
MDWALLRSDATYDVIKIIDGRFFRLDDHLARLRRGSERLRMEIAESWPEVRSILAECVERSALETCVAYAIIARGVPPLGMDRDPRRARNRLYAMAVPVPWIIRPDDEDRSLAVSIGCKRRINPVSVDPTIKNFHWMDFVVSLLDAYDHGADTTILLDCDGNVTEGPGFNVFALKGDVLVTPDRGVLEGITRKTVMEIARELAIECCEVTVSTDDLRRASEIIGTSTAGGILPIGSLDGVMVGDGRPGRLTRVIRAKYTEWQHSPKYTVAASEAVGPRSEY